jgi:anhydro-N-acetylmuramic acid kinase
MPDLAIGIMSGTSCDGVSASLVRFHRRSIRVLAHLTRPYPKRLLAQLRRGPSLTAKELSGLNMSLGEQFSRAVTLLLRQAKLRPGRVHVIGSHGHTIYHGPADAEPSTLQIGEPAVIAEQAGIHVVANFRPRDIACGGEGAPLVPYFDEAFFGHGTARAMQNIGGIANVTVVGRGIRTLAFDTGPGNCLIDSMARRISQGRLKFDPRGQLALKGRIDHRAAEQLWRHPYFRRNPPKSTGLELFNDSLLRQVFGQRLRTSPADVLATVTYFTAYSIAQSLRRFVPNRIREMVVSGGGAHNRTVMQHLAKLLAPVPVHSIERYGIPAQAKEPVAFAYLGLRALRRQINHLPHTTGARRATILGSLSPKPART